MQIHAFGEENKPVIILIHPSMVKWDYFAYVWPLLEQDYHILVPALPGYDPEIKTDYTSVEEIAAELETWLIQHHKHEIACIYGCSMGGSIVTKILADDRLSIKTAVIDGGITPYQLPWLITRLILLKDFCMVSLGKIGGIHLLEKAFAMDEYSREDLQYIADIFKWVSFRTIWRTFDSCNNYKMPKQITTHCNNIYYWYGDAEEKERKWDLQYFQKHFPQTHFEKLIHVGHGGMASLHPEDFARRIRKLTML